MSTLLPELTNDFLSGLQHRIEHLEQEVSQANSVVYPINYIDSEELELTKPILLQVTFEEECYLARFVDANINGSGASDLEAVEMVKDLIVDCYPILEAHANESRLSPEMARQFRVLKSFVRKK